MFELETAVRSWRRDVVRTETMSRDELDELEDHLVSVYESLLECRLAPHDAWATACEALGASEELASEFAKVEGKGWLRTVGAGLAIFAASFFLPAYEWGLGLFTAGPGEAISGAGAFVLALQGEAGVVGVLSALTNLGLVAAVWRATKRDRGAVLASAVLVTGALALNGWWLTQVDVISDLQVGYFAWLSSFAVIGAGLVARARSLGERMGLLRAG